MRIVSRYNPLAFALVGLLLAAEPASSASGKSLTPTSNQPLHVYREIVPLGAESFAWESHKKPPVLFYVMASARNLEFNGQQVCMQGERHVLKTAAGQQVQQYPQELHFRISISDGDGFISSDSPLTIDQQGSTFSEFITGVRFELKVFHALESRLIRPVRVTHIGIPPDVPATERIYDVTFALGDVPISDRLVFHVLTPNGDRLAKFNVDLY